MLGIRMNGGGGCKKWWGILKESRIEIKVSEFYLYYGFIFIVECWYYIWICLLGVIFRV